MSDFLLNVLAVIIGVMASNYLHGFIFAAAKADKYEDVLADKIAKRVMAELSIDQNKKEQG